MEKMEVDEPNDQYPLNNTKMKLQELNVEFLYHLIDRLSFEVQIQTNLHSDEYFGEVNWLKHPWYQPMYLVPFFNIVQRIKSLKHYFNEFNVDFPSDHVYGLPWQLLYAIPNEVEYIKEEELICNGEKVTVHYRQI